MSDQSYTAGEAIRPLVLPEAVGGNGALSYELTPEVPGLTFDQGARTLSGTPSTANSYTMTYRVTDADDNTTPSDADTQSFTIAVREGDTAPAFTRTVADQSYAAGEAIRPLVLPEAVGGNGALSYELTPEVPGLTFDQGTRTLSGTPTSVGNHNMTYRVVDSDTNSDASGADHLTFRIEVYEPQSVVDTIVTSVAVGNAIGVFRREVLPASTGGPRIQVSGSTFVINGGSFFLDIVPDQGSNLKKLLVSIGEQTFGYYDITLSDSGDLQAGTAVDKQAITKTAVYSREDAARNSDSSYQLIGQVSQDLELSSLCVAIVAVAENDMIGPRACHDLEVVQVGTGDVQISLSWDVDSDVDLHVVDPNGDEIYWSRRTVSSGGQLDLDSNAGCRIDGVRNENVTWAAGRAPRGLYTVRVNYWSSCGVSQTNYVIRVNNGGLMSAFSGTLTGSGDRGGLGSGEVVTTFMVPHDGAEPDTAPSFAGTVAGQNYTVGEAISPLVLPDAVGGNGALSYALQPEVPGLTFDTRTRALSGTPSTSDTYQMTYRVSDADGNTADSDADTLTFTITVRPAVVMSCTYRGSGDDVCSVNPDGQAVDQMSYELRLGAARPEVYLIATNTNSYLASARVQRLDAAAATEGQGPFAGIEYRSQRMRSDSSGHAPPWIVEFNNNPPRLERSEAPQPSRSQALGAVAEGDRFTFISRWQDTTVAVPATARRVVSDGSTTLAVWVADREWSATCRAVHHCMTQEMVDALAGRFLRPGDSNDIYDWVTAIFGLPWGAHRKPFRIPPESASQIHVLFFDIGGDSIPTRGQERVNGYFHGLNNYLRADDPAFLRASNERLMFFMDAPLMAHRDGPTWDVTDPWPDSMISVLAHEFQHMIHFYQKAILRGGVSEAWLNEMASEVTEDLVADKIESDGPRGVGYHDPTAGEAGNWRGRLGRYNFYNYIQVTAWNPEDALKHYSINYALGAYLARTYGGAALFGDLVASGQSGVDAIETALRTHGHHDSFGDVLQNWGVATLLSDNPRGSFPYRYNSGGTWSTSRAGGESYRLGSINLYNYRYDYGSGASDYLDGPRLYRFQHFSDGIRRDPHSNAYTTLGRMTGTARLRISASAGLRITVVVKE